MSDENNWIPLESNPEVINKFIWQMGVSQEWGFTDVFGMDPELLAMLPQPVLAILMLFPITEKHEEHGEKEYQELKMQQPSQHHASPYFTRQTIGNACGTIAVIHALANNQHLVDIGNGTLKTFLAETQNKTAEERAKCLEQAKDIQQSHRVSALEGQTEAPDPSDDVNLHFVCFIHHNRTLYELDGRKHFPIPHGTTTPESLAEDACRVVQEFMQRDPENVQFTLLALAPHMD